MTSRLLQDTKAPTGRAHGGARRTNYALHSHSGLSRIFEFEFELLLRFTGVMAAVFAHLPAPRADDDVGIAVPTLTHSSADVPKRPPLIVVMNFVTVRAAPQVTTRLVNGCRVGVIMNNLDRLALSNDSLENGRKSIEKSMPLADH